MAGYFYALAVFVLGFWLAYEANALGLRTAAWLTGARLDLSHHTRMVQWPDGKIPFYRVAMLYGAGLLGNMALLLGLACAMALGFIIESRGAYPYEAANMVITMFGTWIWKAADFAGLPFSSQYWADGGVFLPMTHAMIEHVQTLNGPGSLITVIAYELGQIAAVYLAISVIPLLIVTPVGRAVGQWFYSFGEDVLHLGYRQLSKLACLIGVVVILLVESPLVVATV